MGGTDAREADRFAAAACWVGWLAFGGLGTLGLLVVALRRSDRFLRWHAWRATAVWAVGMPIWLGGMVLMVWPTVDAGVQATAARLAVAAAAVVLVTSVAGVWMALVGRPRSRA